MSEDKVMPKVEDKTPCDHEGCDQMVTTHPAGRAAHMRTHKGETVAPSAKSEADAPKDVDLSKLKEEKRLIVERALAAQDSYRNAPDVFLSEDTADENMALIMLHAPHCLDKFDNAGKLVKRATAHAFYANEKKLEGWASRGYVPQLGGNGDYVTNSGGDVLCVCDIDLYEARERSTQNESRDIVKSAQKDVSMSDVKGVDGDNSDLRDTSLRLEKETITV